MYDLFIDPPAPLVPRRLRRKVRERLLPDGSVLPLDEDAAQRVIGELGRRGRESRCDLPAARLREPGP